MDSEKSEVKQYKNNFGANVITKIKNLNLNLKLIK